MKIKKMIIMLFVFLSLVPLTILEVTNLFYYNDKLENILENDLRVAVTTQGIGIENFFVDREADADILCNIESVKALLEQKAHQNDIKTVAQLLSLRVQHTNFLDEILITDVHLNVIAGSGGATEVDSGLKQLDFLGFGPELKFTDVLKDEAGGKYVAAVQAVMSENQVIGYLITKINLNFFEGIRSSAKLFNNGTTYIIDRQGEMVAAGDTVMARDSYILSESELKDYQRAWNERDLKAKIGVLKYKAVGEQYISCYMELENMGWRVISSVNVDKVLGYKRALIILGTTIATILAALLLFVNYFVHRYFAVPINHMVEKFQRINEAGDYSIRMEVTENNEIGVISKGINSLLDNLETYLLQQREEREKLRRKAEKDLMTGLYNKESMRELMCRELERIKLDHVPVACLFIDVDDFKSFNTRYGHFGGDQVLRFLANMLEAKFSGIVGRHGGDEFIVMLSGEEDIRNLELHIKEMISLLWEGFNLEKSGKRVSVRCSFGAVISRDGNITYDELVAHSDETMYKVKDGNKNGYLIVDI